MRIFLPELVFMFPGILSSLPRVPTNFENWKAALLQPLDFTIHNFYWFFNKVEFIVNVFPPTELPTVHGINTSLGWIRDTYVEPCSTLEAAQACFDWFLLLLRHAPFHVLQYLQLGFLRNPSSTIPFLVTKLVTFITPRRTQTWLMMCLAPIAP
ncbi:hypothetical protein Tco_1079303, partial [Tanacetum coccineum]